MGVLDDIVAGSFTEVWESMDKEQRAVLRTGTLAGEKALGTFNKVTEDDKVDPAELEAAIVIMLDAMDSVAGRAIQAYFWSLFKSA